jgi:8-oxo-dGTP pyrophosphatase MutT (NUDIX family)
MLKTLKVSRVELRSQLLNLDLSDRPEEAADRDRMITLLDHCSTCFSRETFPAHFTGSALVVSWDAARVLLHHHRKLDRWLQFGGHCDGSEDVLSVARREAFEESGIAGLTPISNHPFDLDIHEIPALGAEPAHEHYDVRYLFAAPNGATATISSESNELRWFTLEQAEHQNLDPGLLRMIARLKINTLAP